MGTRTASPRGRYGERLYPRHHAEGSASQFRAKGEHKANSTLLRELPLGRLMAVSDIIPFGQKPELHTLSYLPARCRDYRPRVELKFLESGKDSFRGYGQAPSN